MLNEKTKLAEVLLKIARHRKWKYFLEINLRKLATMDAIEELVDDGTLVEHPHIGSLRLFELTTWI